MLEHEPHPALAGGDIRHVLPVEENPAAAGIGEFEARDDPQERGLPGSGRAEKGHELALRDIQVDAVERRVGPEFLPDPVRLDAHGVPVCLHSTIDLSTSVARARSARRDATAKAPTMLYSL